MRRIGTVVSVAAAAGIAIVVGTCQAGQADAAPSTRIAPYCVGLSPNVIDIPYSGEMTVHPLGAGAIHVVWSSPAFVNYNTRGSLSWTNLRTGRSGSVPAHFQHNLSGYGFGETIRPGAGPVRLTTRAVNTGLLTLGAPTCTGTVHAR